MPPKNWMIAAPGAEARAAPRPKTVKASRMPRPGPGLASSRKSTDLPSTSAWEMPSGVSTPWLTALLRKKTFAGSISSDTSGSSPALTSPATPADSALISALTSGARPKKPATSMRKPKMPAENMFTSISKPAGIRSLHSPSSFFISQAASGAMIIAPMNMCTWPSAAKSSAALPSATHCSSSAAFSWAISQSEPPITPMVAITPTTAPRAS